MVSDFSVLHRVDDVEALPGPRFFKLAVRLPHYQGAVQAAALAERDGQPPAADPRLAQPAGSGGERRWNPGTRATLMADPDLAGLFSFGSFG